LHEKQGGPTVLVNSNIPSRGEESRLSVKSRIIEGMGKTIHSRWSVRQGGKFIRTLLGEETGKGNLSKKAAGGGEKKRIANGLSAWNQGLQQTRKLQRNLTKVIGDSKKPGVKHTLLAKSDGGSP